MSADVSSSGGPTFRPARALVESAVGLAITFVVFSSVTVLIVALGSVAVATGTPAGNDSRGLLPLIALYALPTVVIALVLIVVIGLPTSYLLGWLTRGIPSVAMTALHFAAALVIAGAIYGLLLVAVSPGQNIGFGAVTAGIILGIVPGFSAAAGAGLARLIVRSTTKGMR
jgi:hypothetical protein